MLWSRTASMSPPYTWALLAIQILLVPLVLSGNLQPPLNITTVSRNFSLFLTWLPAPENPPDVYYSVRYKLVSESSRWTLIKHCKHINVTECDLTCDLNNLYANYNIKVRSILGEFKSLWEKSEKISYIFTACYIAGFILAVDPAPPALNVTRETNTLTINATPLNPRCIRDKYVYDVKYRFKIWIKHEKSDKILYNIQGDNTTMTINIDGHKGNLCVAAQTEYIVHKIKYSNFSSPICQLLNEQEESNLWTILIPVLIVFASVVVLYYKCRKTSCETKKPDALIFENHKPVLRFSGLTKERYHKLTMVEKMECPSTLISISTAHTADVEKDYPRSGFGYTEKHRLQQLGAKSGDSLGYTLAHSQSLQSYPNSDNSSSSDVGHGEYLIKSGPTAPFILTLDDIETKRIDTETTNNKYNVTKPAEIKQLIERQENVPFNTLRIAGTNEHIDNSDGESYDQSSSDNEESPKQSNEDLTIYDISENFYSKRQQTNRCTGYEQRGYMAREL